VLRQPWHPPERVDPANPSALRGAKRYSPYDGQILLQVPEREKSWPSKATLAWHNQRVFRRAA